MTATVEAASSEPQDAVVPPHATPAAQTDVAAAAPAAGTEINAGSGPIHTGTGNQLNDIKYLLKLPREARTSAFTSVQLRKLWRHFVPPPNFDRAAELLAQREGLVILNGVPDSGRRTAGLMLLSADITPDTEVRFIPPELELHAARADRRMFEGRDVREGDRLLLDLSEVDADSFREQEFCLQDLQSALLEREAKLVVILPHLHSDKLSADFRSYEVRIGKPAMLEVLDRQLAAHGIHVQNASQYSKTFAAATMTALVQLVYQVRDAQQEHPDVDAEALLAEVLSSGERRTQKAANAVQAALGQRARALLIAAALLHGQSTRTVFVAQHRLLELLRTADGDVEHPLELAGVDRSLTDLVLELSVTPDQRLEFAEQDIAAEILQRFWDDMPWLREPMTDWLGELVKADVIDRFDLAVIANRFGAQCRRTRHADLALRLVDSWSGDRQLPQRAAAYALLADLLDDDQTGSLARQMLYAWATDPKLSGGRVAIVVAACGNILAERYLDQAVVRLSWLTRHSDRAVRYEAREGLQRLAENPGTRLEVIDLVLEPWRFTPLNFAAAAAPAGLLPFLGDEAAERIVQGWQRALTETEPPHRARLLEPWLAAHGQFLADDRQDDARLLLELLATICANRRDLLDALSNTMLAWYEHRSDDPLHRRTAQAVDELVRRERRVTGRTPREAGA